MMNNQDIVNLEKKYNAPIASREFFRNLRERAKELREEALLLSIKAGEVTKEAEELLEINNEMIQYAEQYEPKED